MKELSSLSRSVCLSAARAMAGTPVKNLTSRQLADLWILAMAGYLREANGIVVEAV